MEFDITIRGLNLEEARDVARRLGLSVAEDSITVKMDSAAREREDARDLAAAQAARKEEGSIPFEEVKEALVDDSVSPARWKVPDEVASASRVRVAVEWARGLFPALTAEQLAEFLDHNKDQIPIVAKCSDLLARVKACLEAIK